MALLTLWKGGSFEMLKKRIIAVVTALALFMAVAGVSGVVADSLGFSVTPSADACNASSGSGGGC
jgi:hypothetical protein